METIVLIVIILTGLPKVLFPHTHYFNFECTYLFLLSLYEWYIIIMGNKSNNYLV